MERRQPFSEESSAGAEYLMGYDLFGYVYLMYGLLGMAMTELELKMVKMLLHSRAVTCESASQNRPRQNPGV
jgi:hypothetical protein